MHYVNVKVVMQRIVKRFLLHNQRESDGFEKEFQELKQDLQMIRYEMTNDLKRTKEDTYHSQHLIHAGLNILGDEIFHDSTNDLNISRFNEYKILSHELNETLKEDDDLVDVDNGDGTTAPAVIDKNKIFPDVAALLSEKKQNELRKKTFYDVVNSAVIKKADGDTSSLAKLSMDKESESFELTHQSHSTRRVEPDTVHLVKDASVDE
jgi:hypothetical protein